ncbi:hypothetical protein ABT095_27455 [Kitasatospora sp. NPDC002227]|uniref:hypothetical protein n=1 Tax=Kitasatospora sp. NPDC002227 TaxID=3154773 RepID=UPI00331E6D38
MAGEYRVDPEALRRYGRTSADRAERLRQSRAELGGHRLPADAFGKLPEAQEIGQEYQRRTDAALDNLTSAADTMEQIGEHTGQVARSYERAEQETVDALTAVAAGLAP